MSAPGGLPGPGGSLPGPGGSAWSGGGLPGPGGVSLVETPPCEQNDKQV